MSSRLAVVVAQSSSGHPAKRALEESLIGALQGLPDVKLLVTPHLYDVRPGGPSLLALQRIQGDLVVCSWLYERAARWILNRHGVRGQPGEVTVRSSEEDHAQAPPRPADKEKSPVSDTWPVPERRIYCLDLRVEKRAEPYLVEIQRIAAERQLPATPPGDAQAGSGPAEQRVAVPGGSAGGNGAARRDEARPVDPGPEMVLRVVESVERRWYPVIDYSRCTNCLECVDFCLFGVYGIDEAETILVEQPDNCRKGCPACSRVCPEQAIIFPQHKTPAIAGGSGSAGERKFDLSQLFGAPNAETSQRAIAAAERQEQLQDSPPIADGDPAPDSFRPSKGTPAKDELDWLLDALDESEEAGHT